MAHFLKWNRIKFFKKFRAKALCKNTLVYYATSQYLQCFMKVREEGLLGFYQIVGFSNLSKNCDWTLAVNFHCKKIKTFPKMVTFWQVKCQHNCFRQNLLGSWPMKQSTQVSLASMNFIFEFSITSNAQCNNNVLIIVLFYDYTPCLNTHTWTFLNYTAFWPRHFWYCFIKWPGWITAFNGLLKKKYYNLRGYLWTQETVSTKSSSSVALIK